MRLLKCFWILLVFCILCFSFSQVTFQIFTTTGVPEICKLDISQLCPQAALPFVFCVFFYSSNNLTRIKWFGHSRMKHSSVLVIANNYHVRPGYLFALRCDFLENSHFLLISKNYSLYNHSTFNLHTCIYKCSFLRFFIVCHCTLCMLNIDKHCSPNSVWSLL